jgi:hypothetical protein
MDEAASKKYMEINKPEELDVLDRKVINSVR